MKISRDQNIKIQRQKEKENIIYNVFFFYLCKQTAREKSTNLWDE